MSTPDFTPDCTHDIIILGAGAAGLFAAGIAGQRGKRVLVIDHAKRPAEKVRISGGGRCNFTNLDCEATRFLSENIHFAKSALARYGPWDFISLMAQHGLTYTEKHKGQLFCDQKSGAIIDMLLAECAKGDVEIRLSTSVKAVNHVDTCHCVDLGDGVKVKSPVLIVATGGLSIPKMGATGLAYDIARAAGHRIVEMRPGLVPYAFSGRLQEQFAAISGVAVPVTACMNTAVFDEDLLFTHRGLSGPAALQTSSYWHSGDALTLDLTAGHDLSSLLKARKQDHPKQALSTALEGLFPARVIPLLLGEAGFEPGQTLANLNHAALDKLTVFLRNWTITPTGTEGYRTAEVTVGGIATEALDQRTMESRNVKGLRFIGECVDVTGWLGGYNFQWAWASAHAAATAE